MFEGVYVAFQLGLFVEKPGQGLTLTGNGSGLLFSTKNRRSWNLHLKKKSARLSYTGHPVGMGTEPATDEITKEWA